MTTARQCSLVREGLCSNKCRRGGEKEDRASRMHSEVDQRKGKSRAKAKAKSKSKRVLEKKVRAGSIRASLPRPFAG